MKVFFDRVPLRYREQFSSLAALTLKMSDNSLEGCYVSLSFVKERKIKKINVSARGVDSVTDVLSFPMLDKRKEQSLTEFEGERDPNGLLNLGDIVICPKRAKSQAKVYGHSYKRELMFLFVHGLLHLLGFDHMESEEEKEMMTLAENILICEGLGRKNV